jgi:YD repeat-containing protein
MYEFGHDRAHRLTSKEDRRAVGSQFLAWSYDPVGNVKTKTNYGGDVTEFQYDDASRLVGMRNQNYLAVSYQYDPAGRLLNRVLSNGDRTDYTYDAGNRLATMTNRSVSGGVESWSYTRDPVGNITNETDSLLGAIAFKYDKRPRHRAI